MKKLIALILIALLGAMPALAAPVLREPLGDMPRIRHIMGAPGNGYNEFKRDEVPVITMPPAPAEEPAPTVAPAPTAAPETTREYVIRTSNPEDVTFLVDPPYGTYCMTGDWDLSAEVYNDLYGSNAQAVCESLRNEGIGVFMYDDPTYAYVYIYADEPELADQYGSINTMTDSEKQIMVSELTAEYPYMQITALTINDVNYLRVINQEVRYVTFEKGHDIWVECSSDMTIDETAAACEFLLEGVAYSIR